MKQYAFLIALILIYSCTKKGKEVEEIDLSGLKLTQIPDSVFTHLELKELYLGVEGFVLYPPLSALPELQNGNSIQTGHSNNLIELDDRISQLKNLKILNLVANQLRKLPESIIELKNLEDLDLSLNHDLNIVDEIPKLKQLHKLKTLKIVDVQFKEQQEIVKKALEPRVRVIVSVAEYFPLDSLEFKKATDFKIKPSDN
jgi:Leucine-rich repeat (LRR) protein